MSLFEEGQAVRIVPLGKTGTVVTLQGSKHCIVRVGGLELRCKQSDLRPIEVAKPSNPNQPISSQKIPSGRTRGGGRSSIDLHGMTREQALRAVEQFLSDAVLDGLEEVQIIHGRGTGTLKAAVHQYLERCSIVSHFSLLGTNTGVTRVVL